MNKKIVALVLACVLIFSCVVGGTLALLMDKTEKVTNTFTFGNVDITLEETDDDKTYKLVPGEYTDKDPIITVTAGSESAYVFVKVEKSENCDDFVDFDIATGWTPLAGQDGVYYRTYTQDNDNDVDYHVLADDRVLCLNTVTKTMVDGVTAAPETAPTLSFTAYAVQTEGVADAAAAWAIATAA